MGVIMFSFQRSAITGLLIFALLVPLSASAGNLDSSGAPSAGSNMPTLTDIYNQLDTGAASTPAASFQEPLSGPTAGTGKTLSDIKAKLPSPDNTNGATTADVLSGKTFWGLRTDGTWGPQTGNNANLADTGSGDATAADIKNGKKAWVDGSEVTGTLYGGYTCNCAGCQSSPLGRWCDNNDGTVRDMTTGLLWLKDMGWGGYRATNPSTNPNAFTVVYSLASGTAGLTDGSTAGSWRLPSENDIVILGSGIEGINANPGGNVYLFINRTGSQYATISKKFASQNFSICTPQAPYSTSCIPMSDGYVWPVR